VIVFSGVDGSGKSTQAGALKDLLKSSGRETAYVWAPGHLVDLRRFTRIAGRVVRPRTVTAGGRRGNEPSRRRVAYPLVVAHLWALVMAVAIPATLWRAVRPHLRRDKVVIFDRYALDFAVFLCYRHGSGRNFRLQLWLLRALAPRPRRSYFFDVPPEVSLSRKLDSYDEDELRRLTELYRAEASFFGAQWLDGTRDRDDLRDEIARDASAFLPAPPA
jgi:thymidylate kinase